MDRDCIAEIASIESQVNATNVGIEAWSAFLSGGYWLGYARIGNGWRIAVVPGDRDGTCRGDALPLVDAPQSVRLEAFDQLEGLIERLTAKASELVSAWRTANLRAEKVLASLRA